MKRQVRKEGNGIEEEDDLLECTTFMLTLE